MLLLVRSTLAGEFSTGLLLEDQIQLATNTLGVLLSLDPDYAACTE